MVEEEEEPILLDEDESYMFQEWRAQMQEAPIPETQTEPMVLNDELGNPQ